MDRNMDCNTDCNMHFNMDCNMDCTNMECNKDCIKHVVNIQQDLGFGVNIRPKGDFLLVFFGEGFSSCSCCDRRKTKSTPSHQT